VLLRQRINPIFPPAHHVSAPLTTVARCLRFSHEVVFDPLLRRWLPLSQLSYTFQKSLFTNTYGEFGISNSFYLHTAQPLELVHVAPYYRRRTFRQPERSVMGTCGSRYPLSDAL